MANSGLVHANLSSQLREIDQPHQIALALLAFVLKRSKTWVLAHPETHFSPSQQSDLNALIERLQAGEPLPYLLGRQAFFGLDFLVSPAVLIPRPETELLVEEALNWLKANPQARRGMDIGTGSGCIAISLVSNCPDLNMIAIDISPDALKLAEQNALRHNAADRIELIEADLLPDDVKEIDLLCANLPYIPSQKLSQVNSLPWEPSLALDGGADGLVLFRRLFQKLTAQTSQPSLILLEIEDSLGDETISLCQQVFPLSKLSLLQDLNSRDRLIKIEAA